MKFYDVKVLVSTALCRMVTSKGDNEGGIDCSGTGGWWAIN